MKMAVIATGLFLAGPVLAQEPQRVGSVWQNPSGSVHIRVDPCEEGPCGRMVWASERAIADSARGGHPDPIGMVIVDQLRADGKNRWRGRVFAPDMNRHFSGTVTLKSDTRAQVRGCALGRTLCRNQTWTLVSPAP
jgi:uncharacterized protein (DUF2147 family)